jgi:hypothetical protein
LPAAVLVSIGCPVALRDALRAFTVRAMSCPAGKAINARDHQYVTLAKEVEDRAHSSRNAPLKARGWSWRPLLSRGSLSFVLERLLP